MSRANPSQSHQIANGAAVNLDVFAHPLVCDSCPNTGVVNNAVALDVRGRLHYMSRAVVPVRKNGSVEPSVLAVAQRTLRMILPEFAFCSMRSWALAASARGKISSTTGLSLPAGRSRRARPNPRSLGVTPQGQMPQIRSTSSVDVAAPGRKSIRRRTEAAARCCRPTPASRERTLRGTAHRGRLLHRR
jgi:hypothetical protein